MAIELFLSIRHDQPIISTFQVVLKPQSTSGYRTHFFCGDELGETLGHCGEIHGGWDLVGTYPIFRSEGFLKWTVPQVTVGFNTKSWSSPFHIKHQEIQQTTTNNAKKKKHFTRWSEKTSECSPCFAMLRSKKGASNSISVPLFFRVAKTGWPLVAASPRRRSVVNYEFRQSFTKEILSNHPKRIEKGWQRCDLPLFWD